MYITSKMKWMGGQRKRNLKSNNYFNKKSTYRRQKAFFKNHTNVKPPHIQRSNNNHHVSTMRLLSKRKDSDARHVIDLDNNDGEIYDINTLFSFYKQFAVPFFNFIMCDF